MSSCKLSVQLSVTQCLYLHWLGYAQVYVDSYCVVPRWLQRLLRAPLQVRIVVAAFCLLHIQVERVDMKPYPPAVYVTVHIDPDPEIKTAILDDSSLQDYYLPLGVVAEQVGVSSRVIARLTSAIRCEKGSKGRYVAERWRWGLWVGCGWMGRG